MVWESFKNVALVVGVGVLVSGLAQPQSVAGQDDAETQAKITSAMAAGPSSISSRATIYDNNVDAEGDFIVLRDGSNS